MANKWIGIEQIGRKGDRYLTRLRLGRLCLHVFWRGDEDPECHDHPWDYWTFPFRSYVESVRISPWQECHQIVRAWEWSFRPAEHAHRIIRPVKGGFPLITVVWTGPRKRDWGFWRDQEWVYWRRFLGLREG